MKSAHFKIIALIAIGLIALIPVLACAAPESTPPVAPPIVREGTFAVSLADALELGAGDDEILAESRLGELGISPRNGWIADYPVTPDILGELQQTLIAAADGSRLQMSREEALERFYDVNVELGLSVVPYADESIRDSSSEEYPAPATVNNYYYNYGPPVVTYYEPPPGYVYLYAWVPFPFWSWGFWFPGFYVLHDFHKTVVIDSRVVCVSNHYRDVRYKRVYVVDPVKRYHHSGTVYGVGAPRHPNIVYKGSPGVARQVLDINRDRMMRTHIGRNVTVPSLSGRSTPVVRPVSPNREKNRPAPIKRAVNTPVHVEKNDRGKKESVQPKRIENSRTTQARRPVPVQNDKIDRQVRPMLKSIETKPAQTVKSPRQVEQKMSRPQPVQQNAGNASRPRDLKQAPSPRSSGAPARIQPQQKNEGQGSVRPLNKVNQANQGRQDRGRGSAQGSDKKEAPSQMRGSERGGRS